MAGYVAEKAMVASERLHRAVVQSTHQVKVGTQSQSSRRGDQKRSPSPANQWNKFQKVNSGKGWSIEKMRAEYYKAKKPSSNALSLLLDFSMSTESVRATEGESVNRGENT